MAMALLLSQCIGIGVLMEIPISERNSHNQWISKVVSAIARYTASVLDRETTSCLLLRQDMREVPKKMQYPMVERQYQDHLPSQHQSKTEESKMSLNYRTRTERLCCGGIRGL